VGTRQAEQGRKLALAIAAAPGMGKQLLVIFSGFAAPEKVRQKPGASA
jgi:hypothetical protein